MPALQTDILRGDCLDVLKRFPDEHFDLVFTSPPYADRRKHTYGGIKPEHYVKWLDLELPFLANMSICMLSK